MIEIFARWAPCKQVLQDMFTCPDSLLLPEVGA